MKKIIVAAVVCLSLITAVSSYAQNGKVKQGDMFIDFTVQQDPSNPSSKV